MNKSKINKTPPTHYTMGIRENLNATDRAIQSGDWARVMAFTLEAQRHAARLHEYAKNQVIQAVINP